MIEEIVFERGKQGDMEYFESQIKDNDYIKLIKLKDEDNRTLLHNIVISRNAELVEYALNKGFNKIIDEKDDEGWAPLHSAASMGLHRICELLIMNNATVDIKTNALRTPLHYASSKGHGEILELLLKNGSYINFKDKTGSTALHRASSSGQFISVKVLMSHKANMEIKDVTGSTPLLIAVTCKNDTVALYLTSMGANIDAEDNEGVNVEERAGVFYKMIKEASKGEIEFNYE